QVQDQSIGSGIDTLQRVHVPIDDELALHLYSRMFSEGGRYQVQRAVQARNDEHFQLNIHWITHVYFPGESAGGHDAGAWNAQTFARQSRGESGHAQSRVDGRNHQGDAVAHNAHPDVANQAEVDIGTGDDCATDIQIFDQDVGSSQSRHDRAAAVAGIKNR